MGGGGGGGGRGGGGGKKGREMGERVTGSRSQWLSVSLPPHPHWLPNPVKLRKLAQNSSTASQFSSRKNL